jgi:3-dehydroquinate synthase
VSVISIHSNVRDYTVYFQDDCSFINKFERFSQRLFVIDENVWQLHGKGCLASIPKENLMLFTVTEERKGLKSVMEIYDRLMEKSAKKNMTLISIGGGILQDVTGFVASTLYRGLNWIFVPTTLLAQSDSCIGSKTSLNYKRFKNILGTFYPPAEVHIQTTFLRTLSENDFLSGLGEVVKLHIMGGRESTDSLILSLPAVLCREPDALLLAISTSLSIKLNYIEGDEYDTGRRNLLNFGHCFGHALETVSNYAIPHGQAVVVGMIFANLAALKRKWISYTTFDSHLNSLLLKSLSIPIHEKYLKWDKILDCMRHDKKRVGNGLVMIMMRENFSFEKVVDFSEDELRSGIEELKGVLNV